MTWTVVASNRFKRRAERFRREHPSSVNGWPIPCASWLADPFQLHLRMHPLGGEFAGIHAISLTHADRITLTLQVTAREVILLNIGSHDEVYH